MLSGSLSIYSSVALLLLGSADPGINSPPILELCTGDRQATLTERFAFHSDPLVNLHHFLREWASLSLGLRSARPRVSEDERAIHSNLTAEDRDRWNTAVLFYRELDLSSAARSDHLDMLTAEARRVQGAITDLGGTTPGLVEILESVMDLYCTHWWPAHDLVNRNWVGEVAPILERHEELFVEATTRLYASEWPEERWRVDVSAYAPFLGYASRRGAIVVHSTDELNAGLHGVETVLHELQHTREISAALAQRLEEADLQAGGSLPAEIGHALIYATAGEVTQGIALADGVANYTPFWIRQDFQRLPMWEDLLPAIQMHWLPAVRGEQSGDDGLDAVLRAFDR